MRTPASRRKTLIACKINIKIIKQSDTIREVYTYSEGKPSLLRDKVPKIASKVKKLYPEFGRNVKYVPIINIKQYLNQEKINFAKRYKSQTPLPPVEEDDFQYIRFLGKGAYATVNMVRKLDNDLYYARKEISKHIIFINKIVGDVKNEKRILQSIRHPFTINLKHFYQDNIHVYLLLPLMAGGVLYSYVKKLGKFKEDHAKFVLSQLVLALEYLHYLGLIHRDLKLENILLDHIGYIKLGDFGMCKWINHERTYSICGTAEYLAPEVLNHKGYGLAADWWSFGILAFEICSGKTPFVADEYIQIFYLIMHNQYEMPKSFSYPLSNLISHLLEVDLTRRYGKLKDGVIDIKSHEFFKNLNWIDLINRKIDSPLLELIALPEKDYFQPQEQPPIVAEKMKTKYDKVFDNF